MAHISEKEREQIIEQCRQFGAQYEALFMFIYNLRHKGFNITPSQFITIQKLLLTLLKHDSNLVSFHQLKTYIAPIICSSPKEQASFYSHYDQLYLNQPLNDSVSPKKGKDNIILTNGKNTSLRRLFPFVILFLFIVIIPLFSFAYVTLNYSSIFKTQTFTGIIVDRETNQPLANAEVAFDGKTIFSNEKGEFYLEYQEGIYSYIYKSLFKESETHKIEIKCEGYSPLVYSIQINEQPRKFPILRGTQTTALNQQSFSLLTIFIIILILSTLVFTSLLMLYYHNLQLNQFRSQNQPNFKNLPLIKNKTRLYRNPSFRHILQKLRQQQQVESDDLNIIQTVDKTAIGGGLFSPIYTKRQATPEYLVLIDRLGFRDHKSLLEDKIIDSFKKEGVLFECYYFNSDPRLCHHRTSRQKEELPKYLSLQNLAILYPQHRLLIFSDGAGLIDNFSNRPYRWVSLISKWKIRAMLTPNSALDYNKWILEQECGLPIISAKESDLKAIVEILSSKDTSKSRNYLTRNNYPPTLNKDIDHWWLRYTRPHQLFQADNKKETDKLEVLCFELRNYLGKNGYLLLCVCAVYPEITGDLTFYLAEQLVPKKDLEATLELIVCLPWFRQATMPNWLRERLISDLTTKQENYVRKLIIKILEKCLSNQKRGANLRIASPEGFHKKWKRFQFLHNDLASALENNFLRDYIFMQFISENKTAFKISRKIINFLLSTKDTKFPFLQRIYNNIIILAEPVIETMLKLYYKDNHKQENYSHTVQINKNNSLAKLPLGETARVIRVTGNQPFSKRLMEMGIVPGVLIRSIKTGPFGSPLLIKVRDYYLALRLNEAENIEIERLN